MPQPKPCLSAGPEQVTLAFSFTLDGSGDPLLLTSGSAAIDSITESAGVFTITLNKDIRGVLVACVAGAEDALTFDAQYTSYVQSTGVLTVSVGEQDGAVVAGALASSSVHVIAILCRRSQMAPAVSVA